MNFQPKIGGREVGGEWEYLAWDENWQYSENKKEECIYLSIYIFLYPDHKELQMTAVFSKVCHCHWSLTYIDKDERLFLTFRWTVNRLETRVPFTILEPQETKLVTAYFIL